MSKTLEEVFTFEETHKTGQWRHKKHFYKTGDAELVADLDVCVATGNLILRDSSGQAFCLIHGNVSVFVGHRVSIDNFVVLEEVFALPDCHWKVRYLFCCASNVRVVDGEGGSGWLGDDVAYTDVSVSVVLHLMTRPRALSSGEAVCFMLVSEPHGEKFYLVMRRHQLYWLPLLSPVVQYKLTGCTTQLLCRRDAIATLPKTCEGIKGVYLPEEVQFTYEKELKFKENIYSVRELQQREHREIVSVEGVVVDRFHFPPQFAREMQPSNIEWFGNPGFLTIVIVLEDVETTERMSLYINNYPVMSYPLGLIPNALLNAMHVRIMTSGDKPYLQATDITRFQIRDMRESVCGYKSMKFAHLSAYSVIRTSGRVCGVLARPLILKVMKEVTCHGCNSRMQTDMCSYVGCLPGAGFAASLTAMCLVETPVGNSLLFVKDKVLQTLLGIDTPVWSVLCRILTRVNGNVLYHCSNNTEPSTQTPAQLTFGLWIRVVSASRVVLAVCDLIKPGTATRDPQLACKEVLQPTADLVAQLLQHGSVTLHCR